jgi:hypothetical protein
MPLLSSPDVTAHLEGYRAGGVLESSGSFSLSDEKAQAKFRQFQLPEPRLYVLNLQAAAVCGGARWIDFEGDADDLYFRCDATLGPSEALRNLNSVALSDSSPQVVREMAFALNGCLALSPKELTLRYWDGERGTLVAWKTDRFVYEALSEPMTGNDPNRLPTLEFHLREKPGRRTMVKFFSRMSGAVAADSEQDAVARHCNRSPVPLRFNGTDVVRPIDLRGVEKALLLSDGQIPPHHPLQTASHVKTIPTPGPFRGLLVEGGRFAPWVTLVLNGVSFKLADQALDAAGLRGVIYIDKLQKDLSQVQLAQDGTYRRLVDSLKALAGQLACLD